MSPTISGELWAIDTRSHPTSPPPAGATRLVRKYKVAGSTTRTPKKAVTTSAPIPTSALLRMTLNMSAHRSGSQPGSVRSRLAATRALYFQNSRLLNLTHVSQQRAIRLNISAIHNARIAAQRLPCDTTTLF